MERKRRGGESCGVDIQGFSLSCEFLFMGAGEEVQVYEFVFCYLHIGKMEGQRGEIGIYVESGMNQLIVYLAPRMSEGCE